MKPFPPRCWHVFWLGLLVFSGGAISALAQTLNNPGLEPAYNTINVTPLVSGASMTGQIANGWIDNSNWADVVVVYAQETANVHGGSSAQRMDITRVGSGSNVQFVQDFSGARAIQPNRVYTVSTWLRASAAQSMIVSLRSKANTIYLSQTVTVGTGWQQVIVSGNGPTVATDCYLMVKTNSTIASPGLSVWMDDATLTFNQRPTVSITAPLANANFTAPAAIPMTVSAADSDGTVAKVEFFDGATKLGESTSAPFDFTAPPIGPGTHSLTAKATDNAGGTMTSAAIPVTVTGPLVSVAATDASASENGDAGVFAFTRDATSGPLTVSYALSGTAVAGNDYTAPSGTVTFANGAATATLTITPLPDVYFDSNDTVIATVMPGAAYGNGSPSTATVTIADTTTAPFSVLPKNTLAVSAGYGIATRTVVSVAGPTFPQALRMVTADNSTTNIYANPWDSAARFDSIQPIAANDVCILEFWARTVSGNPNAQGKGFINAKLQGANGTTESFGDRPVTLTSTWRKLQMPYTVPAAYAAGGVHVYLMCGFGPQTVEVGGLTLVDYGPMLYSALPIELYDGHSPTAAWRAPAAQRIDQLRKSDLTVTVRDLGGNPMSGATVRVRMKRHAFGFGSEVDTPLLTQTPSTTEATQIANQIYRDKLKENFNWGTLGNELKWGRWETADGVFTAVPSTVAALDWMLNNRLASLRGQCLLWPRWADGVTYHLPTWLKTLYDGQIASVGQSAADAWLRARVRSHITEETTTVGTRVKHWDVINETWDNHDLQDILGTGEMAAWFQAARTAGPGATLLLNDYSNEGEDLPHITHDLRAIALIDQGQPTPLLDAIGVQSHLDTLSMTGMDQVMATFNGYAALGKQIEVTEFDVDANGDEQLQAEYLRDYLTICFSHPAVTTFMHWGFWEGSHWKPPRALFRTDWSIKPNGQMWKDLVFGTWWTDVTGATDASGNFAVRGFRGDYEVTATSGTRSVVTQVTLGDTPASFTVVPRELTTATLSPTADAYVQDGGTAGTNYGTSTALASKLGASGSNRDSYLRFDLSAIPEILSAKIRLNAALITTPLALQHTVGLSVHAVSDTAWGETAINWNNRPALGAVLDNVNVVGTSNQWVEMDVSAYLRAEKAAGHNLVTLGLHNAIITTPSMTISSRNASSNQPQLVLGIPLLPTLTVSATTPNAAELGPVSGVFTLSRTGDVSIPLAVNASVTGSATAGLDYSSLTWPASFSAGAATLNLAVLPMADSLAEGSENIILTLASSGNYTIGAANAATVTLADRPYDAWRFANNQTTASEIADLDFDGFPTLVEYALGSNPNLNARPLFPQITRVGGLLTLTYQRLHPAEEITYRVEVSGDLVEWSYGPGYVSEVTQPDGFTVVATDLNPAQNNRRYIRLRIIAP